MFFYLYVVRFGFLDGAAGYHYACMRFAYEIMIDAKSAHHRYQSREGSAPPRLQS